MFGKGSVSPPRFGRGLRGCRQNIVCVESPGVCGKRFGCVEVLLRGVACVVTALCMLDALWGLYKAS